MRLPEEKKIVPVMNTADYNPGVAADSINMKGFHRCSFFMTFGAITGDAVLTVNSGATDGATTSALTFNYALANADIGVNTSLTVGCDVLGDNATSAALTLTAATYNSRMLVVEVDASDMDVANDEDWLTLDISNAASAGICHIVAVLEPRYTGNISRSALV